MSDGRMIFEHERQDLANIVRVVMTRKNNNIGGGNFSFIVNDDIGKRYIIMTPTMMSQAYLGELSAAQILVVEPHTREIISGVGELTREINMHEAIYDSNPEIKAVLHAHAPGSLFWSTSGFSMPNVTEATQKLRGIPVMDFAPACSEELANTTSNYISKFGVSLPNILLLRGHGVLINTGGKTGVEAIHSALAILDTTEWNAEIAYKQTVFQALGLMDHYESNGQAIGTLNDLKNGIEIYNHVTSMGGD